MLIRSLNQLIPMTQAEKWHLDLDADLAELENRELLDKVKQWEESELSSQSLDEKPLLATKRLKPISEGPMQSLQRELDTLRMENEKLKRNNDQKEKNATKQSEVENNAKLEKLSSELAVAQQTLSASRSESEQTAQSLQSDLSHTKSALDDLKKQLKLTEKELEKKFSETGAYRNLKKMLGSKNEQIRQLRSRLAKYEKDDNVDDEEE